MAAQLLGHLRDVVDREPALDPVGRGQPDEQRLVVGPGRADGVGRLDEQPRAVLQRAAVLVVALVGQRREELVQQVAVGGVQLDDVEPGVVGASRGGGERRGDARRSRRAVSARGVGEPGERRGRRADGRPAALVERDRAAPGGERARRRGLAARVRQLDADLRAALVHEVGDPAPLARCAGRATARCPAARSAPRGPRRWPRRAAGRTRRPPANPGGRGASRSGCRRRPSTGTSAPARRGWRTWCRAGSAARREGSRAVATAAGRRGFPGPFGPPRGRRRRRDDGRVLSIPDTVDAQAAAARHKVDLLRTPGPVPGAHHAGRGLHRHRRAHHGHRRRPAGRGRARRSRRSCRAWCSASR